MKRPYKKSIFIASLSHSYITVVVNLATAIILAMFINLAVSTTIAEGKSKKQGKHVAVVTRVSGDVVILTDPSNKVEGKGPHVSFNGKHYREIKVRRGSRLKKGNVIRSMPNGKARLIFKNGDALTVGKGTSYEISWKKEDSAPLIDLFYGKIRGIFKKDGARSGTKVHTRSSVMGVRGTDFVVINQGATEISVLRGAVNLKPANSSTKPVTLETGFTAKIEVPVIPKVKGTDSHTDTPNVKESVIPESISPKPFFSIRKTSKRDLVTIQKAMKVVNISPSLQAPKKPLHKLSAEEKKIRAEAAEMEATLEALEVKCTETVMEDIKKTDPILYEKIKDNGDISNNSDMINKASIGELFKKAPISAKETKPNEKDLEDLGDGAYQKYFGNTSAY